MEDLCRWVGIRAVLDVYVLFLPFNLFFLAY